MRNILVPLLGLGGDRSVLEGAYCVARLFDSHIDTLHVRSNGVKEVMTMTLGDGIITQELWDVVDKGIRDRSAAAQGDFAKFCREREVRKLDTPEGGGGPTAACHEYEGEFTDEIAKCGRTRDLVVIRRDPEPYGFDRGDLADIVMQSGRPVMLLPAKPVEDICGVIAIAWKSTPESARAVTAAAPLLAKARKVVVLTVIEGSGSGSVDSANALAETLRWRGLDAEVHCLPAVPNHKTTAALIAAATSAHSDMLVMGGYGHSRARELILGGVTNDVLESCELPVLIAH